MQGSVPCFFKVALWYSAIDINSQRLNIHSWGGLGTKNRQVISSGPILSQNSINKSASTSIREYGDTTEECLK